MPSISEARETKISHIFVPCFRHQIYEACRGFQAVFHEARERAIKGVAFAKTLRKDFEVSAEYAMNITAPEVIQRLYETGHVRIVAPLSSKHLIFIASTKPISIDTISSEYISNGLLNANL